ncbi:MAG: hypothetical protein U0797_17455 [Gemmataceae bacterium]
MTSLTLAPLCPRRVPQPPPPCRTPPAGTPVAGGRPPPSTGGLLDPTFRVGDILNSFSNAAFDEADAVTSRTADRDRRLFGKVRLIVISWSPVTTRTAPDTSFGSGHDHRD